ncbi:MAG TPA: hypothetical protein VE135_25790 [Pyrinomonadaceae bacterium]|nr:hypothetical protein [Pyrinomonadaceae bacterium]
MQTCPFKPGDIVVYRPTKRGQDLDVMTKPEDLLQPGAEYRVADVQNGQYVVVEGNKHPGGGLYWTEFEFAPNKQ